MIVWQGLGHLVVIIALVMLSAMNFATRHVYNDSAYFGTHGWPGATALLVAAMVIWFLGRYLQQRSGRVVIDKATGREMTIGERHSLFFIPMHYWGPILAVGAVAVLFIAGF